MSSIYCPVDSWLILCVCSLVTSISVRQKLWNGMEFTTGLTSVHHCCCNSFHHIPSWCCFYNSYVVSLPFSSGRSHALLSDLMFGICQYSKKKTVCCCCLAETAESRECACRPPTCCHHGHHAPPAANQPPPKMRLRDAKWIHCRSRRAVRGT